MPTGYTYRIEEDPEFTFEHFVWVCARAFGALMEMRDEPLDAPIPESVGLDAYDTEATKEAEKELALAKAFTLEEAEKRAAEEYQTALVEWAEDTRKQDAIRLRYAAIRARAADWDPPTSDHENLKKFMLEQIDESTRYVYEPQKPVELTGVQWLDIRLKCAQDSLRHAKERLKKGKQQVTKANTWVKVLRESVPPPVRNKG